MAACVGAEELERLVDRDAAVLRESALGLLDDDPAVQCPLQLLVFAAFLFTNEPTLTQGDLVDNLQISAGSASTGIRALLDVGLLEQVPAPGSRRDHYRLRDDAWATLFSHQNAAVRIMREAADAGIARSKPGSPTRQRLENMRGFYDFLLSELPTLVERWQRKQARANAQTRRGKATIA